MRHAPVRSGRGGKLPAPAPGGAILHVSHAHGELVPCIGPWERRLSSCLRQSAAVRGQTEETWPEVLGFALIGFRGLIPTASFNSVSNVLVLKGVVTSRSWLT